MKVEVFFLLTLNGTSTLCCLLVRIADLSVESGRNAGYTERSVEIVGY